MSSDVLQLAVIAALRRDPPPATMGELCEVLREELTINSMAPVAAAIQALRYQGKLAWDKLELSPPMVANGGGEDPPQQSAGRLRAPAADGPEGAPSSGPDDEEDDGVNDLAEEAPAGRERPLPSIAHERATGAPGKGFVPPKLLHQAGIHAANTVAARRPVPVPEHEPEISRLVREEASAVADRRNRARSTGTVRQPLEVRKFGVPDLSLGEAVTSLLAESPHDLVVAVTRKHPELWRRILLLGRATDQRPAAALYAVIEAGLEALEPQREEAA